MPYVIGPFKQIGIATLNYIPRFVTLVLIIFVMRYLLRFLHFVFSSLDKGEIRLPGFDPQWATSTYHLVRILVVLITLIIGYPYLPGSETAVFNYAAANKNQQALDILECAFDERDPNLPYLGIMVRYAALHKEPRFQEMLLRLNFPEDVLAGYLNEIR